MRLCSFVKIGKDGFDRGKKVKQHGQRSLNLAGSNAAYASSAGHRHRAVTVVPAESCPAVPSSCMRRQVRGSHIILDLKFSFPLHPPMRPSNLLSMTICSSQSRISFLSTLKSSPLLLEHFHFLVIMQKPNPTATHFRPGRNGLSTAQTHNVTGLSFPGLLVSVGKERIDDRTDLREHSP